MYAESIQISLLRPFKLLITHTQHNLKWKLHFDFDPSPLAYYPKTSSLQAHTHLELKFMHMTRHHYGVWNVFDCIQVRHVMLCSLAYKTLYDIEAIFMPSSRSSSHLQLSHTFVMTKPFPRTPLQVSYMSPHPTHLSTSSRTSHPLRHQPQETKRLAYWLPTNASTPILTAFPHNTVVPQTPRA